jgi:hypothetical protein
LRDQHVLLAAGGAALFDAVHDRACAGLQVLLESRESFVDALPTGGEEIDEQPEVVDARMSLREDVALQALESAEQLVHQPTHLGELTADGTSLGRDTFLDGFADLRRQRRLELSRSRGEVFETLPRALQGSLDVGGVGASLGSLCETLPRALDRVLIHRTQD